MKFKLLCYYCYSNMPQPHVKEFFLFDFVHRFSSTVSLLLSELSLSSVAKFFEIAKFFKIAKFCR